MTTLFYAGLCVLLLMFLSWRVVQLRRIHKIGIGDGGNAELLQRIRVHANAVEYMPMLFLLLGGMELNGYPQWLIHVLGAIIFVSRCVHAWGLSHRTGPSKGRVSGMLMTYLLMLSMAVISIYGYLQAAFVTASY
ncbi:MAG: MAPEG family protein [Arenimonas sp.]